MENSLMGLANRLLFLSYIIGIGNFVCFYMLLIYFPYPRGKKRKDELSRYQSSSLLEKLTFRYKTVNVDENQDRFEQMRRLYLTLVAKGIVVTALAIFIDHTTKVYVYFTMIVGLINVAFLVYRRCHDWYRSGKERD